MSQPKNKYQCAPLGPSSKKRKNRLPCTCLTKTQLVDIAREWNKTAEKSNRIKGVTKMKGCELWQRIRAIRAEEDERKWSQKYRKMYRPGRPFERMSTTQLNACLAQYETAYPNYRSLGAVPRDFEKRPWGKMSQCVSEEVCRLSIDGLLRKKIDYFSLIINTHDHKGQGEHWVSIYCDLKDWKIYYFDSAGSKPLKEATAFMTRLKREAKKKGKTLEIMTNAGVRHQFSGNECGMFCLYFIIQSLTGNLKFSKDIIGSTRIPSKLMKKFRGVYFQHFV